MHRSCISCDNHCKHTMRTFGQRDVANEASHLLHRIANFLLLLVTIVLAAQSWYSRLASLFFTSVPELLYQPCLLLQHACSLVMMHTKLSLTAMLMMLEALAMQFAFTFHDARIMQKWQLPLACDQGAEGPAIPKQDAVGGTAVSALTATAELNTLKRSGLARFILFSTRIASWRSSSDTSVTRSFSSSSYLRNEAMNYGYTLMLTNR